MLKLKGTGILPSLVIVAIAAVALYQPDPPRGSKSEEAAVVEPAVEPAARSGTEVAVTEPSRLIVRTSSRRAIEPHRAFTTAGPGETLADVARRVYGDESAARAIWMANRDQLPRFETPLTPGIPLRTP